MVQVAEYSHHLEKIIAALNVAQEVQQSLLPQHPPKHKRLNIAGTSLYCDETGGDYYDYIELPCLGTDACAFVVGDVSGHGISSALLMAGVRAYLRGRATQTGSAAEIITDLNRLVCADTEKNLPVHDSFLPDGRGCDQPHDLGQRRARPHLCVRSCHGSFRRTPRQGAGARRQCRLAIHRAIGNRQGGADCGYDHRRSHGDHNERSELFGRERFKEIISRNASQDAEEVLKAIVESVEKFRGEASQHDDITLVVLKFEDDATFTP